MQSGAEHTIILKHICADRAAATIPRFGARVDSRAVALGSRGFTTVVTSKRGGAGRHSRPDLASDSTSTIEIIARAQRGESSAIQTLVARAAPPVRRWAKGRLPRYVRQDANTEDVVQDAVLHTLKGLKRIRHRTVGGLQAYLRTGVMNRIRDLIRGAKRHGISVEVPDTLHDEGPSPLEAAIRRQRLEAFLEALGRLKPADRTVVIWRIELGYTADEIATRLGKSKAAAGMSVTRAIARLAIELGITEQA